jgi:hypothetical protein
MRFSYTLIGVLGITEASWGSVVVSDEICALLPVVATSSFLHLLVAITLDVELTNEERQTLCQMIRSVNEATQLVMLRASYRIEKINFISLSSR